MCAVTSLAGCELLMPSDAFDSFDDFAEPIATYATGRATVKLGTETLVLDRIAPGPHVYKAGTVELYWYNDEGWGMRLMSFQDSGLLGEFSDLSFDRVQTTYWTAMGGSGSGGDCAIRIERADATGLHGSATCTGLRWLDQLHGGTMSGNGPPFVEDQPAFDATVTFDAEPAPGSATPAPAVSPSPSMPVSTGA
jgi:hypothetical protein